MGQWGGVEESFEEGGIYPWETKVGLHMEVHKLPQMHGETHT